MKNILTYILLMVSISSCDSISTKYHEPTPSEVENSLKRLYPVGFSGIFLEWKNMGLKVRRHELVVIAIDSISQDIMNNVSSYCYKWDSGSRKLDLILTRESTDFNEHLFEGYKLVKEKNSDKIRAYDRDGKFVKEFIIFE